MIKGVKELYRRSSRGESLPELPGGVGENMLIHEVLASLDVLPESADMPDSDQTSVCGDVSTASSICGSSTSEYFFAEGEWQIEPPTLTTSPTSDNSRDTSLSPPIPTMAEIEGIISQFEAEKLGIDTLPNMMDPTPRAVEMSFQEAFSDIYLMGQDPQMNARPVGFVNPQDTSYRTPFHMTHAYTG